MEWHNGGCRKLDLFEYGGLQSCLSCGLADTAAERALPCIKQDKSEIRLLRLVPGSIADEVRCHVVVEDLTSNPTYSAISYTWGDENGDDTKCATIFVDQKRFRVTKNCKFALQRARTEKTTVVIWIDAICIDQENSMERKHQVTLMPEIYSRAQQVLVYVGESTYESIRLFKRLKDNNNVRESVDELAMDSVKSIEVDTTQFFQRMNDNAMNKADLKKLFGRRYFSRVWILQEIALSRMTILLCGKDSISWTAIAKMVSCVFEPQERPPVIDFNRRLCLLDRHTLEILDMGRHSQATDARDKVYALLGLLPDRRMGQIEADYTLSVEELYIRVALELSSNHDWSDVLIRAGTGQQVMATLPSWTPDWSCNPSVKNERYQHSELRFEPLPHTHWIRYEHEHQSVKVRALRPLGYFVSTNQTAYWQPWIVLRSSYTSASSTYLWMRKDSSVWETIEETLRSPSMPETQSFARHQRYECCLTLILDHTLDNTTWTMLHASVVPAAHILVSIEDALELFTFTESQIRNGELRRLMDAEPPLITVPSSSISPIEEFWKQNYYAGRIKKGQDFTDDSIFIESHVVFWRYLARKYAAREEWLEIR